MEKNFRKGNWMKFSAEQIAENIEHEVELLRKYTNRFDDVEEEEWEYLNHIVLRKASEVEAKTNIEEERKFYLNIVEIARPLGIYKMTKLKSEYRNIRYVIEDLKTNQLRQY